MTLQATLAIGAPMVWTRTEGSVQASPTSRVPIALSSHDPRAEAWGVQPSGSARCTIGVLCYGKRNREVGSPARFADIKAWLLDADACPTAWAPLLAIRRAAAA